MRVNVQPPSYLRKGEQSIFPALPSRLPQGSVVTVRGVPEARGRRLVLSDGQREVPFVDDASGSVVARWKLDANATLRVAARFGEVLVPEREVLVLISVPDQAPQIELEDAPRAIELRAAKTWNFAMWPATTTVCARSIWCCVPAPEESAYALATRRPSARRTRCPCAQRAGPVLLRHVFGRWWLRSRRVTRRDAGREVGSERGHHDFAAGDR